MAAAVVFATKLVQSSLAIFCIAGSHRSVDQLSDFAAIVVAAIAGFATVIATTIVTGHRSTATWVCSAAIATTFVTGHRSTATWVCSAVVATTFVTGHRSTAAWVCSAVVATTFVTGRRSTAAWICSAGTIAATCTAGCRVTAAWVSVTAAVAITIAAACRCTACLWCTATVAARRLDVRTLALVRVHIPVTRTSYCRFATCWLTFFSTAAALAATRTV